LQCGRRARADHDALGDAASATCGRVSHHQHPKHSVQKTALTYLKKYLRSARPSSRAFR
jgi:hypothetical protein